MKRIMLSFVCGLPSVQSRGWNAQNGGYLNREGLINVEQFGRMSCAVRLVIATFLTAALVSGCSQEGRDMGADSGQSASVAGVENSGGGGCSDYVYDDGLSWVFYDVGHTQLALTLQIDWEVAPASLTSALAYIDVILLDGGVPCLAITPQQVIYATSYTYAPPSGATNAVLVFYFNRLTRGCPTGSQTYFTANYTWALSGQPDCVGTSGTDVDTIDW